MVYSKDELKEEMHRVSREHCSGETPTKREMKEYGKISESTYYRIFGSWNEAVKQCGFKVNEVYSKTDREYEREELVSELRRLSKQYREGGSPRYRDVVQHSDIQQRVFINEFGSWNKALEESGFNLNMNYRNKEGIINKIKQLYFELGRSPTVSEFDERYSISRKTVLDVFDSWNNALAESGLELNQYQPTKSDILNEIKNISEETNRRPTIEDFRNLSKYSQSSVRSLFGTWNNAVEEAGFEPQPQQATGKSHAQWKGGVSDVDYGSSWNQQRKRAIERDGYKCRICSNDENIIDVHHITPVRFWKVENEHKEMNRLNNLISLCRPCHGALEGKFKARNHREFQKLASEYIYGEKS